VTSASVRLRMICRAKHEAAAPNSGRTRISARAPHRSEHTQLTGETSAGVRFRSERNCGTLVVRDLSKNLPLTSRRKCNWVRNTVSQRY
jgi:hypothetical protein